MNALRKIARDWFTEPDCETHDPVRVLATIAILAGIALAVYSVVVMDKVFDVQTYGLGMASLFAGVGAALGFKKDTAPKQDP